MSKLETQFAGIWSRMYPEIILTPQFMFAKPRKFRADFAHPEAKVLIEIQGGIYTKQASHFSIGGIKRDIEKQFTAASCGYLVFLLHTDMINTNYVTIIANTIKDRLGCKEFTKDD